MFETVVRLGASNRQMTVPNDPEDGDGLNFLAGKSMDFIRDRAMEGTLLAHTEGGVPNVIVQTDGKTARDLGRADLLLRVRLRSVRLPAGRESLRPARRGGV